MGTGTVRLPAVRQQRALVVRTRTRHPNRSLTEAHIRLLLAAVDDIRDDAFIRVGLSVGLRVSEVVAIRTPDIDVERGVITI